MSLYSMSRQVLKKRFCEDEDEDEDDLEEIKCPPQRVPWPNPNEIWASRKPATSHKDYFYEDEDDYEDVEEDSKCLPGQNDDDDDDDSEEEQGKRKIRRVDPPRYIAWTSPNEVRTSREAKNTLQGMSGGQRVVSHLRGPDVSAGAASVESQGHYLPFILEERCHDAVKIPGIGRHTSQGMPVGGQHVVSTARSPVIGPGTATVESCRRHRPFRFEERHPGAVTIPGIDVNEGYDDQATVATRDDPTINVVARVVDTQEENQRLHDQERMRHERDQAVHERDQLRRVVDNAVVVTPVVAADRDVEIGNEEVAQVSPGSESQKAAVRRWKFAGVFLLLILIVVGAVLGIILSRESEPGPVTGPEPTPGQAPGPTLLPTQAPSLPTLSQEDLRDLLSSVSSDGGEALQTPSTPQNMAFNWLAVNNTNLGTYTNVTIIQHYALATLYFSTNGNSWENNELWLDNSTECSWWQDTWATTIDETVNCTDTGALVVLDLLANNLEGNIPPEIGLLTSLEYLWLSGNALNGTVPTEFGLLSQLTDLDLNGNSLSGRIPSEIWLLSSLDDLDLSDNMFDGMIPTEIGQLTQLTGLLLSVNALTGTIPSEMSLLSELQYLWLSVNALNGTVPTEFGLLSQLYLLIISTNKLTGSIPSEINSLTNLADLYLSNNRLTGTIPSEMSSLTNLEELDLSDNALTGTIPSEVINSLYKLEELSLYDNMFTGSYTCPHFIDTCGISCDPWSIFTVYNDACESL